MIGRQPLIRRFQTPPAKNPRPGRRSMYLRGEQALPDLQKEVRSLVEENEMLRKEAEDLHRACAAASAENRTLQLRLDQRNTPIRSHSPAPRAKQEPAAPPPLVQCDGGEGGGFRIPDLNLPASDDL
uniref:Uncharacterized protein n=1 Tax=Ananas comosus var. bracteatus TaxID=296719 RepID=A0A6V7PLX4_ANACO|nr:unnamed protein product [Ananas comosus var. bracteatus]